MSLGTVAGNRELVATWRDSVACTMLPARAGNAESALEIRFFSFSLHVISFILIDT